MEEKKQVKIRLSTAILLIIIIALLIIGGMYIYYTNKIINTSRSNIEDSTYTATANANLNQTSTSTEIKPEEKNETVEEPKKNTIQDMYFTKETEINGMTYTPKRIEEQIATIRVVVNSEKGDLYVSIGENKQEDIEADKFEVAGCNEKIVDLEVSVGLDGATLGQICYLTEKGNVYVVNDKHEAVKKLSGIVRLYKVDEQEVTHVIDGFIAQKEDGTYVKINSL